VGSISSSRCFRRVASPAVAPDADGDVVMDDGAKLDGGAWTDFSEKLFRADLAATLPLYDAADIMQSNPLRDREHCSVQ
jgi:hypothetical protein